MAWLTRQLRDNKGQAEGGCSVFTLYVGRGNLGCCFCQGAWAGMTGSGGCLFGTGGGVGGGSGMRCIQKSSL